MLKLVRVIIDQFWLCHLLAISVFSVVNLDGVLGV